MLEHLPYSLAILPYHFCFYLAKFALKGPEVKIWARNSYALKRLSPGQSDIDLTFIFLKNTSAEKIKSTLNKLKKLRFFFPILGEVNSYKENEILSFLPFLNFFEVERDQKLKHFFKKKSSKSTFEEAIVYMLRMLKADQKNLLNAPQKREKKWRYHCEQVNIPYATYPLESIITHLLSRSTLILSHKILIVFFKIDETHEKEVDTFYSHLDIKEKCTFILLFPLRWIVVTLRNHEFENDMSLVKDFTTSERQLLFCNISWEIWGIYSQYHDLALTHDLVAHLENIEKILIPFKDEKALELIQGIYKLRELILNYKQE